MREEFFAMRVLFGMIVGAALTIGGAYVHDTVYASVATDVPTVSADRPMVNWDVANAFARRTSAAAREQWNKLSGN
jgi:hypothetical protein